MTNTVKKSALSRDKYNETQNFLCKGHLYQLFYTNSLPDIFFQRSGALFIFIFLQGLLSCNKNTNQLPLKDAPPFTISKIARLNGIEKIEITIAQTTAQSSDTLWAWARNMTSNDIENVQVLVELCSALPHNYDNCNMQKLVQVPLLKANDTGGRTLLYVNKNIVLDKDKINVAIVDYAGPKKPLSGLKDNVQNLATIMTVLKTDTAKKIYYYADINGYISADGKATLRLKWGGANYYNFLGDIIPDTFYVGRLYENTTLLLPVVSEKIAIDTLGSTIRFTKFEESAADTIKSIVLTLRGK